MHSEWFSLEASVAKKINAAKAAGRRVIAVGTTSTRVLESCAVAPGVLEAREGETDIFIYPPHQFQIIDGLITNFHLPESTLLMLVSALVTQPNAPHAFSTFAESVIGKAYQTAIDKNYRFYSFGDAMLIE
jgi:S-adenosylmethionine:tRNA ribosyltransferase-isomerase